MNWSWNIDYESMSTDFSSREEWIEKTKPNGIGIEIGVQAGVFSKKILEFCPNLKLYLLDCWQEQQNEIYEDFSNVENERHAELLKITINSVLPYFDRVRIIKDFSENAVNFFPNEFFDFIYIDANHEYSAVVKDLNLWYPKLKKGGIFSGHDYLDGSIPYINPKTEKEEISVFKVKMAVDEFAKKHNLQIKTARGYIEKYYYNRTAEYKTWITTKPLD